MSGTRHGLVAAALAALLAGCASGGAPAAALPELSGQVLQVGCRQGQCLWARVSAVEQVERTGEGALRRLVVRRGTSTHDVLASPPEAFSPGLDVAWEAEEESLYAFCSTQRPAYAFPDEEEGGLTVHRLDLFDLGGYQTSSARMYLRLCHDRDLDRMADADLTALGYRPDTGGRQERVAGPEALLRP